MTWREIEVRDVPRRKLEALSTTLFGMGAAGLQEDHPPGTKPPERQPWDTGPEAPPPDPVWVRAWFEHPAEAAIRQAVHEAVGTSELVWTDVPDTDWEAASEASFPPLQISPRLTVAPPWNAPEGSIIIEPGLGFGTGDHPTTAGALRALDALADSPGVRTVWDIGCGSGVLAIAAAKLGLVAQGVDIDADAVGNAHHNARLNGLEVAFSTTPVHAITEPADLVLANLYAEVLVGLAGDLIRITGQHLVLAGVLADRETMVRQALDPHLGVPTRDVDGEWVCLHYQRPTP